MALPDEIILMILDLVYTRDLEGFAATNSRIRRIAHHLLEEHRSLKHIYSTIDVGVSLYRSLEYLVLRVARHWLTAEYPERLRVTSWLTQWQPTRRRPPKTYPIAELAKLPRMREYMVKLRAGDEDGLIAVLILMLPRLRILEVELDSRNCECLTSALKELRSVQMQKTPVGSREAPNNLQTIRIRDSVGTSGRYPILHALLQLPSVKTAEFIGLQMYRSGAAGGDPGFEPSNLQSLTFTDCTISTTVMHSILKSMNQLENFSFVADHTIEIYLPINPYFIQAGLAQGSLATLRTLRILGCYIARPEDDRKYQYMGSLRRFRVLEHVTLDLETLFDETQGRHDTHQNLWTQLPKSIRTATLHSHVEEDFDKLPQDRATGRCLDKSFYYHPMYPRLEALTFRGMSQTSETRYVEDSSWLRYNGVFVDFER